MIGIIPAAGKAERMGGIPKFLLPTPEGFLLDVTIKQMRSVPPDYDIDDVIVVGNRQNIDYIQENILHDISTRIADTENMCQTLLSVRKTKIYDPNILFAMPDTYFNSPGAFYALCRQLLAGADIAVGLWYTEPEYRSKRGMCAVSDGRVTNITDKPVQTDLTEAWGILAWKPTFWEYIKPEDTTVSYALQRAVYVGLRVDAVRLDGTFWDCGTPDEYFAMIRDLTGGHNEPT